MIMVYFFFSTYCIGIHLDSSRLACVEIMTAHALAQLVHTRPGKKRKFEVLITVSTGYWLMTRVITHPTASFVIKARSTQPRSLSMYGTKTYEQKVDISLA